MVKIIGMVMVEVEISFAGKVKSKKKPVQK
jgi:hypothetical protein